MKSLNAIELLEFIRKDGPISRARLAARSGLSKPTVSDQVDGLIARGLVLDTGPGSASARGGKKPTLLEFNAAYGQVLCADIGPERIRFAAANLGGSVLRRNSMPIRPEAGPRAVLRTLKRGIGDLIRGLPESCLRVVSVAVPGIVDIRQGLVLETDGVFGWRRLPLGSELGTEFGVPVHVDNDVNMMALAELSAGGAPNDFILLRLHMGIGGAAVLGGQLRHGAHFAAGEIGHMLLDLKALDRAAADRRGYLESMVGGDRVKERVRKLAHRCGRERAEREVAGNTALHLAAAIANIALACDPEAIILHGPAFAPLLGELRRVASAILPWPLDIRLSELGEDAALQGALAAGLTHAYGQIAHRLQTEGAGQPALTAAGA